MNFRIVIAACTSIGISWPIPSILVTSSERTRSSSPLIDMKSAGRQSLRALTEAQGSTSQQFARTFACSTRRSKQARDTGQGRSPTQSANLQQKIRHESESRIEKDRIPIAWTTAATTLSDEVRAFVGGSENESLGSFELIPDEQDGSSRSILARSRVRKGVIVECRRYAGSFRPLVAASALIQSPS